MRHGQIASQLHDSRYAPAIRQPMQLLNHVGGYERIVTSRVDKAKDVVHGIEHPVETAKSLEREAEEGRSARTPLIALTGVTLFVSVIFLLVVTVALVLYFGYGGK